MHAGQHYAVSIGPTAKYLTIYTYQLCYNTAETRITHQPAKREHPEVITHGSTKLNMKVGVGSS